jgi:hypothetical protein
MTSFDITGVFGKTKVKPVKDAIPGKPRIAKGLFGKPGPGVSAAS